MNNLLETKMKGESYELLIDYLELFFIKYGPYFAFTLLAVAISKLFSDHDETFKSILKSTLSSLAITFMMIKFDEPLVDSARLFFYVFMIGLSSDFIIETFMEMAPRIMKKIVEAWK